jgi:hypothetical protein
MPGSLSPEHRAALSRARTGVPLSPAHRAALSLAKQGCTLTPEHRAGIGRAQIGRVQSAETRARISATKWRKRGIDVTDLDPSQIKELRRIVKKGADPAEALAAVKKDRPQ